jgi:UDP-N-acetylglucosamine 1-carboxyvinyltransferase
MARILIEGGVPLSGKVSIGGAKNSALPIMAAAVLTKGPVILHNIPRLDDVITMEKVLNSLGVKTEHLKNGAWKLTSTGEMNDEAPYELPKAMRQLSLRAAGASQSPRSSAGRLRHRRSPVNVTPGV